MARIERDDLAVPETLGLTLDEGKQLTAATQAAVVRDQVSTVGERFRWCEHCGDGTAEQGVLPGHPLFRVRRRGRQARVGDLFAELLPVGGAANARTVRNRTMRVGATAAGAPPLRRMIKEQQMRCNRWTVQPFVDVRAAVLNGTLEGMFRRRYPEFRPENSKVETAAAA